MKLTIKQRIRFYIIWVVIGFIISFFGLFSITGLNLNFNARLFGAFFMLLGYILGNKEEEINNFIIKKIRKIKE